MWKLTLTKLSGSYIFDSHDSFEIEQDIKHGDWWIQYGNKVIGYWPSSLFTHLSDSANIIEWGGTVLNTATNGKNTTTQMGSGRFPNILNYGQASYIRNMKFVDSHN